tara:strand:+ start:1794 stop:4160 length:2367 start_codon:yes stop_codon:yes gene_type:complete
MSNFNRNFISSAHNLFSKYPYNENDVNELNNLQQGENGAIELKSTTNYLVDIFSNTIRGNDFNTIRNNIVSHLEEINKEILNKNGSNIWGTNFDNSNGFNITKVIDSFINGSNELLYKENSSKICDLFLILGNLRDVRSGKGERKQSFHAFLTLYDYYPETCIMLINQDFFGNYGRYLDYLEIWEIVCSRHDNNNLEDCFKWYTKYNKLIYSISNVLMTKFNNDYENMLNNEECCNETILFSLVSKWLPNEKGYYNSISKTNNQYRCFNYSSFDAIENYIQNNIRPLVLPCIDYLMYNYLLIKSSITSKILNNYLSSYKTRKYYLMTYRKMRSYLNKNLPEVKQCSGNYSKIDFSKEVASRCLTKNLKAFNNLDKYGNKKHYLEDREQCAQNLKDFIRNNPEKIKGTNNDYHDLIYKYISSTNNVEKLALGGQIDSQSRELNIQIFIEMMHLYVENKKTRESELCSDIISNTITQLFKFEDYIPNIIPMPDISGSMSGIPEKVSKSMAVLCSQLADSLINILYEILDFFTQYINIKSLNYGKLNESNLYNSSPKFKSWILEQKEKDYPFMNYYLDLKEQIESLDIDNYVNNMMISFSESPNVAIFPKNSSIDNIMSVLNCHLGYSTNFEAAIDCVMKICINADNYEHIPDLLVITDGQFNQMDNNGSIWDTTHKKLIKKWINHGFKSFPRIIYWNVRANVSGFEESSEHPGVNMISGWSSKNLFNVIFSNTQETTQITNDIANCQNLIETKKTTPYDSMRKSLDNKEYDFIRNIINESNEGILKYYKL